MIFFPQHKEIIDVDQFIQDLLASGDYYVFQTSAPEWDYILTKLSVQYAKGPADFGWVSGDFPTIFYLSRSAFPISVVSHSFGLPEDMLEVTGVVILGELAPSAAQPTVSYYGSA